MTNCCDDQRRQGTGDIWDVEEYSARIRYDLACQAQKSWSANERRRLKFLKCQEELHKSGVSKAETLRRLKSDPKTSFDHMLTRRAKGIQDEVDSARRVLSTYDPSVCNFDIECLSSRSSVKSTLDAILPTIDRTPLSDITRVAPMTWQTWPHDIRQSGLAYGSRSADAESEQSDAGIGPGEEWLAHIFGGQVQGGNVSFDIVMPDRTCWEVKQLLTRSETIRPGTEGVKEFEASRARLNRVMNQMSDFVKSCNEIMRMTCMSLFTGVNAKMFEYVDTFVDREFETIVSRGEISLSRFKKIRAVLNVCHKLKAEFTQAMYTDADCCVSLQHHNISMKRKAFINVTKVVANEVNDKNVLNQLTSHEIVFSILSDDAFDDPTMFLNRWFDSVQASNVFHQVDGMFIVNPTGFMLIPSEKFSDVLRFEKVSQSRPKFSCLCF